MKLRRVLDGLSLYDRNPVEQLPNAKREATEPEMAICGWCEVAHESEDVLTLLSGERVCTECLDARYGPRRENRWPL